MLLLLSEAIPRSDALGRALPAPVFASPLSSAVPDLLHDLRPADRGPARRDRRTPTGRPFTALLPHPAPAPASSPKTPKAASRTPLSPSSSAATFPAPSTPLPSCSLPIRQWQTWGGLGESIRTGHDAQKQIHGLGSFDYFKANPEVGRHLQSGHDRPLRCRRPGHRRRLRFLPGRHRLDLAGGPWFLLAAMLQENPAMHGFLFDLPEVILGAGPSSNCAGVARPRPARRGRFLPAPSRPGPISTRSSIIFHRWTDAESIAILRQVRAP